MLVAVGTLAGVAVGSYAISRVVRARARIPPPHRQTPAPEAPVRNYVGSGWTRWPHKDVFPDVDAIVQALRRLGYAVDGNLITNSSMAQVGRFQQDYNVWSVAWYSMDADDEWPEAPASPGHEIGVDDLVGANTVSALYDALLADERFHGGWQALVDWYADRA